MRRALPNLFRYGSPVSFTHFEAEHRNPTQTKEMPGKRRCRQAPKSGKTVPAHVGATTLSNAFSYQQPYLN